MAGYKEFTRKYEEHKDRLFILIAEIKETHQSFTDIEDKVKRGRTAAVATGGSAVGVGLLGLLAAPFTLGVSLVAAGTAAAAGVSGAATAAGVEVAYNHEMKQAQSKLDSLQQEFMSKVQSVQSKLEATKPSANSDLFTEINNVSSKITSACHSKDVWDLEEALKDLHQVYEKIHNMI